MYQCGTLFEELIEEKVAELIEKVKSINSEYAFEAEEKFAYQQGFQDAIAMFYIDLTGTPKTKGTIQATIDTVAAEQRSSIKIDSSDMQKVGDHYWGGDYEPTYYELEKLTESMNEILQTKLKALDNTPPNKV